MVGSLRLLLQASVACGVCLAAADVPQDTVASGINNSLPKLQIPSFQLSPKQVAETEKAKALANALPHAELGGFGANIPSNIVGGSPAAGTKDNLCAIPLTEVKVQRSVEFFGAPKPKSGESRAQPKIMKNFDRIGVKPAAPTCPDLRATATPNGAGRQR